MHKLAELCVRRPVFATMLILGLSVIGVFSVFALGVDLFPNIDLPTVVVTTANPGASAASIETEITRPLEDVLNTIGGIDELRSASIEGLSQVFITFVLDKNVDVAAQEVRDRVNLVLESLPETAETPVVQKFDISAAPILRIVVSAPMPLREVTRLADDRIRERIENVPGVGRIDIAGGREREIRVWVDPERLQAYGLGVNDVVTAVQNQNLELPGGRVQQGEREFSVRTLGRVQRPDEFNDIAIAERQDHVIRLRDVGRADDAAEEPRTLARLNESPAVTLIVSKQSGANTVEVARAVKERLEELKPALPADLRIEIVGDQSVFIEAAIHSIQEHLVLGSILAAAVIYLFLANTRTTLIAAVAIPTSIISTFGFMLAMGYTLNQITMLALTLMVGIVIDDAIIVLENVYRYITAKGFAPFEAAISATREIGLAVMATTLSLLAVFVPVGFMGGIVGRFMSSFGLTAAFAVAVSALVSFTLTPMLCSRFLKPERADEESRESRFFRPIARVYMGLLDWSLRHRWLVAAACAAVIFSTIPLFILVGKNFLPEDDRSEFDVSMRLEEGASLAAAATVAERVARDLRALPGVADTLITVGSGETGGTIEIGAAVNRASIHVRLVPVDKRDLSQQELMMRAREIVERLPDEIRTSVSETGGGPRGADVQAAIVGPDLEQLRKYADRLMERVKTLPDVVDVDSSYLVGKPELRIEIDRNRAADLGVRVSDIAQALNVLVAGEEVSTFIAGDEQYDVRVQAFRESRDAPRDLNRITVSSATGAPVTLDHVVRIQAGAGPSTIDRLNRQRQITVSANVLPGGSQSDVVGAIRLFADELRMAPGYSVVFAGASRELGRAGYYFMLAFLLSFIFMYMVLAAQFESFLHPVTILLTLPIAVPFGIVSLLATGQTVNVFSGLGLLLLFGIVKKNAILQIDHTNGLRAQGMERGAAIRQANRDRLRPILMTTIALVAGMIPLVLSRGPGSATNRSIGVLVVGGQSLCLLLTLLAVPVFYSFFEDVKEWPVWDRLRLRRRHPAHNPLESGERGI